METEHQRLAKVIYGQVKPLEKRPERKKYGTMCHKLPILVRQAGLVQALAFVAARGDETQRQLLDHLAAALGVGTGEDLQRVARTETDLVRYMHLTRRVLNALLWYKRYTQSILKVDTSDEDDLQGESEDG